jgi:hypothetical protein
MGLSIFFELIDTLVIHVESDAEWPGKKLMDVFRRGILGTAYLIAAYRNNR